MHRKSLIHTILLTSLLISCFSVQADLPDTIKIEEVRIIKQFSKKQQQAGVKRQKIDTLALSTLAHRSLSEVLSENTPIFIKTYGRGSMASASFRGTAPSHTKVLWNDFEINNPMLGMVDFSLIPTWFVDDVNLAYGAASVQKTTGALGGSVELNNQPNWNKGLNIHTLTSFGEYHTYDQFLAVNYTTAKLSLKSKAFYSRSENDFTFYNKDIISSVDLATGEKTHPKQKQQQADYEKYGILQEIYYRLKRNETLAFKIWSQKADRSLPMLSSDEKNDNKELEGESQLNNYNKQYDFSTRAVSNWKHYGDRWNYAVNLGYIHTDLDYIYDVRLHDGEINRRIDSKSDVNSFFFKASGEAQLTDNTKFNTAIQYQHHHVDSKEKIDKTAYDESRTELNWLGAIEHQWAKGLTQSICIQTPVTDNKFDPLIWVAGIQYEVVQKNVFNTQFNVTRNYHRPTLNDLYFQPGGNPELKAEEGYTTELDFGYAFLWPKTDLKLNTTGYISEINDWILWLPAGSRGYWEPMNLKKVSSKGIEFKANLSGFLSEKLNYKFITNYAFTKSVNYGKSIGENDLSYGKQLPYIPKKSMNILASLNYNKTTIIGRFNYYSQRHTTTSNEYETMRDYLYSYYMTNLSIGHELSLSKKVLANIQLKVDNLFDEDYRSILQRPMPGRNYTILLDLKF
ncbi:hypothetical protein EYV94_03420 [Puteibacter caeruleilacunae]|nr:hypothetical protein EYV94_03420 [Puteibacter caeruleilacunae]